MSEEAAVVHLGISFDHFLASVLATPNVDASWRPETAFQILAMMLVDRVGYPGTGRQIPQTLYTVSWVFLREALPKGIHEFLFDFHKALQLHFLLVCSVLYVTHEFT